MLPSDKADAVYNALLVGMRLADAYLFAGCTPNEIALDMEDEEAQVRWQQTNTMLEYSLLDDMRRVSSKQVAMGRNDALAWRLEHLFPDKYSSKPSTSPGSITLVLSKADASDIVEIHRT